MKIRTLTVFFWLMLIGAAAVAGEKHDTRIEKHIEVIKTDGDEAVTIISN